METTFLLDLKLSVEDLNTVLQSLGNLPYVQVHLLIDKIQKQAGPQLLAENQKRGMSQHQPEHEMTKQ